KERPLELEALLFGQAAMLQDRFSEDYPRELQKTYHFLRQKHRLSPLKPHIWKWARMRPQAFPTLRMAQFAALVSNSSHLFSQLLEIKKLKELKSLFQIKTGSYWETHYRFEKNTSQHNTRIGENMINNILINTVCPMLAMYDKFQLSGKFLERAFQWMKELPPENNRYTRKWVKVGVANKSAWDSQTLLE